MSAVSRALNVAVPNRWADDRDVPARAVGRWGAPIWKADEPVVQKTPPDALPLNIKLLAFVYSER